MVWCIVVSDGEGGTHTHTPRVVCEEPFYFITSHLAHDLSNYCPYIAWLILFYILVLLLLLIYIIIIIIIIITFQAVIACGYPEGFACSFA